MNTRRQESVDSDEQHPGGDKEDMASHGKRRRIGYQLIADWLREQIESRELEPGAVVPTAQELAATFGVRETTSKRALETLMYEGLIDGKYDPVAIVRSFRPYRRVVSRNHRRDPSVWPSGILNPLVDTREVRITDEEVPESIARILRIPSSALVSVHRSTAFVNDRPIQLAAVFRPSGVNVGTGGFLRVREELRVRMPSSGERNKLDLALGVPVAEIMKTVYSSNRSYQPVEFSTFVIDGSSCITEYDYFVSSADYMSS